MQGMQRSIGALALAAALCAGGHRNVGAQGSAPAYLRSLGSAGSGSGQFLAPASIGTDLAGNLYVFDRVRQDVQRLSPSGTWSTLIVFRYGDHVSDVAIDPVRQWIYAVDPISGFIERFNGLGQIVAFKQFQLGSGPGQANLPSAVAVDASGDVWMANTNNRRIDRLTPTLGYVSSVSTKESEYDFRSLPGDFAFDGAGNLWVMDADGRVKQISPSGPLLVVWPATGSAIATDSQGAVYVGDPVSGRITMYSMTGAVLTSWQQFGDPPRTVDAQCLHVGTDGMLYAGGAENQQIELYSHPPTPVHRTTFGALKARYR